MKELKMYFGKENSSSSFGCYADVVSCTVKDDFDLHAVLECPENWIKVTLPNGVKYVSKANLCWVDLVTPAEQTETELSPNNEKIKESVSETMPMKERV